MVFLGGYRLIFAPFLKLFLSEMSTVAANGDTLLASTLVKHFEPYVNAVILSNAMYLSVKINCKDRVDLFG